jgi:hypothetical protein
MTLDRQCRQFHGVPVCGGNRNIRRSPLCKSCGGVNSGIGTLLAKDPGSTCGDCEIRGYAICVPTTIKWVAYMYEQNCVVVWWSAELASIINTRTVGTCTGVNCQNWLVAWCAVNNVLQCSSCTICSDYWNHDTWSGFV